MASELLREGRPVVVVTCFKASAKSIHAELAARGSTCDDWRGGWACELLTGEVPQVERTQMVERFSARGGGFVFTCGAGGIGITLTNASVVIMVDRALTPGDVEQAEDRVYRIGQTRPVAVHWLRGFSVCRLVDSMLQRKQGVIERLVDGEFQDEDAALSPSEILRQLLAECAPPEEEGTLGEGTLGEGTLDEGTLDAGTLEAPSDGQSDEADSMDVEEAEAAAWEAEAAAWAARCHSTNSLGLNQRVQDAGGCSEACRVAGGCCMACR